MMCFNFAPQTIWAASSIAWPHVKISTFPFTLSISHSYKMGSSKISVSESQMKTQWWLAYLEFFTSVKRDWVDHNPAVCHHHHPRCGFHHAAGPKPHDPENPYHIKDSAFFRVTARGFDQLASFFTVCLAWLTCSSEFLWSTLRCEHWQFLTFSDGLWAYV